MSTRSGKRIHALSNSPIVDIEITLQSARKSKNKNQKENLELSVKKRHNYVSYPGDGETLNASSAADVQEKVRKTRKSQRNTLKDHNALPPESNSDTVRKSHRGKKVTNKPQNTEVIANSQNHVESQPVATEKKRNKKKRTHKRDSIEMTDMQDVEVQITKKKGIKKTSKEVNPILKDPDPECINSVADISDSFHSAAGSPVNMNYTKNLKNKEYMATDIKLPDTSCVFKSTDRLIKKRRKFKKNVDNENDETLNTTFDKSPGIKTASNMLEELATKTNRKSSNNDSTVDKNNADANDFNLTFDKTTDTPTAINNTKNGTLRNRTKSSTKNSIIGNSQRNGFDEGIINTTFDKTANTSSFNECVDVSARKRRKSNIKNSTFDKIEPNEDEMYNHKSFNSTLDHTMNASNVANGNITENNDVPTVLLKTNKVNDKCQASNNSGKSSIVNTTYDKTENALECNGLKDVNTTFDKDSTDPQISHIDVNNFDGKKSLQENMIRNALDQIITNKVNSLQNHHKTVNLDATYSDNNNIELHTSFDKENKSIALIHSNKSSLISSDDTINVTFDKSGDNPRISITSDESRTENILNHTPVLIESSIDESVMSDDKSPEPATPLKREGTFTKEAPDIVTPSKPNGSIEKTPLKRKSSPGRTPFNSTRSLQEETCSFNATRAMESTLRRSSLAEVAPRHTRVMFCSPANNPAVVSQVKGRVIKSNLKGSNKSFVLQDSGPESAGRRKRSLTTACAGAGAAGEAVGRAKRSRLGDELQLSVDRLSRPRTQSAAAKLSEPGTPGKKPGSPGRVSRTRLPNFAALHQKQFARMESLDECQRRRARRARQLLTPTGSRGLLERTSPKDTLPEPVAASKDPATKPPTPAKPKPPTLPKLPTLGSLIPRYTRFGFKLNVGENPFGAPRPAPERPRGPARQAACGALPSLAGATAGRREAARQAVMREKCSERRSVKRDESRTVIRGVRTNRRFELQMRMRHIDG